MQFKYKIVTTITTTNSARKEPQQFLTSLKYNPLGNLVILLNGNKLILTFKSFLPKINKIHSGNHI
jgi:hypothetical protein